MSSGPPDDSSLRAAALQALQRRRYGEAAELLEQHLVEHPEDTEAELELGLAEMLLGRREQFAARQRSLAAHFRQHGPVSRRARQLWQRHQAVADSMAKAAAILVLAGIPATEAGCAKQAPSAATEQPEATAAPTVEVTAPTSVADTSSPAEEPAGGQGGDVAAPAAASATASSSATVAAPAPTRTRPRPKTRYIAVRPTPVPNFGPSPTGGSSK